MDITARWEDGRRRLAAFVGGGIGGLVLTAGTAVAQVANNTTGGNVTAQDLCGNQLIVAMDNLITLLAAIGPVVGALVAMTAMLVLSTTQNPQKKRKWIQTRNDAIKYGVGILFVGAIINLLVQVTNPEIASCIGVVS